MIEITSFLAGKGDCFLLSWNQFKRKRNILIDGGTESTYEYISQKLLEVGPLDAIIITHVDYDHLGGLTLLLEDSDFKRTEDFLIFINTPELYLYPNDTDKVKVQHGIDFEKVLKEKEIQTVSLYRGIYENDQLSLFGLQIRILSPTREIVESLMETWTANDLYKKYQEEQAKDTGKVAARKTELASIESILSIKDPSHKWQSDLSNSSSIAFIASIQDVHFLFLGDSNPSVVSAGLEAFKYTLNQKLTLRFVKISHHGCRHNTSEDLLSRLECKDFYISTDGSGPYYHPNRETIVRISECARKSKDQRLNIFSNYDMDLKGLVSENEEKTWNINFETVETLTYQFSNGK